MSRRFLQQVLLLPGPDQTPTPVDVLLDGGTIGAIGVEASQQAAALGMAPEPASGWLLAPALVDPHSLLEDPWNGVAETQASLQRSALAAGYGTVALLPQAQSWRDCPGALQLPIADSGLRVHLWGALSRGGAGQELAPHADQLAAGAIGLAEGPSTPPLPLLERALALGEMGEAPVLVAARDPALSRQGLVREGVEALRAGWPPDPALSELLPLQGLLALQELHSERRLALMNLSTEAAVALLSSAPLDRRPAATVCWWHLLADCANLDPTAEGWRIEPPLGGPADRRALRDALVAGVIGAVAVHHSPLDPEEQLLPLDQRKPGVAGHRFVLPCLWQELVQGAGWSVEQLWQVLCFGPSRLLGLPDPQLTLGSRDWLLFDPQRRWRPEQDGWGPLAANQPLLQRELTGQVLAAGLCPELWRG